jgi:hypothetical protein
MHGKPLSTCLWQQRKSFRNILPNAMVKRDKHHPLQKEKEHDMWTNTERLTNVLRGQEDTDQDMVPTASAPVTSKSESRPIDP